MTDDVTSCFKRKLETESDVISHASIVAASAFVKHQFNDL